MKTGFAQKLPFHYGWLIVFAGGLSIFACIGLARFSLGMLLPSMGVSLSLSYAEMGYIGTGNFIGYLVGIVGAPYLMAKTGARMATVLGLAGTAATLGLISLVNGFLPLFLLYSVSGIAAATSNLPVMVLVSKWFHSRRRGLAAGLIISNNSFAIMLLGATVPLINDSFGSDGWRYAWAFLGVISALVAGIAWAFLRNSPQEIGLLAYGSTATVSGSDVPHPPERDIKPALYRKTILHLGLLYFLFGATYMIYGTFIVTTLVREYGFSEQHAGTMWSWVGFACLFSGPVIGALSDKIGRSKGLLVVFVIHMIAYSLVGLKSGETGLYISVILYGLVLFSIPTIMTAAAGDYLGPARAAAGFSAITLIFGLGQIAGPALGGVMAEISGSFSSSYLLSAGLMALGIIGAFFLKPPEKEND